MSRLSDKRVQLGLAGILSIILGAVAYYIIVRALESRDLDLVTSALNRYDYETATTRLKKCTDRRPTDPRLILLSAQIARRRGDFNDASRLLTLADRNGANQSQIELEWKLFHAQRDGQARDTDALFDQCKANANDPDTALVLEAIIEGCLTSQRRDAAEVAIDFWLKHRTSKTDQAQGHTWRGRAKFRTSDERLALVDLDHALAVDPDHLPARIWIVAAVVDHDPKTAVSHLDWLRKHFPHLPSVRMLLTKFYRNTGESERAIPLLDELLESTPNHFNLVIERGRAELDLRRPKEAEPWLSKALDLASAMRDAKMLLEANAALGDCMAGLGRHVEAKAFHEAASRLRDEIRQANEQLNQKRP